MCKRTRGEQLITYFHTALHPIGEQWYCQCCNCYTLLYAYFCVARECWLPTVTSVRFYKRLMAHIYDDMCRWLLVSR